MQTTSAHGYFETVLDPSVSRVDYTMVNLKEGAKVMKLDLIWAASLSRDVSAKFTVGRNLRVLDAITDQSPGRERIS